MSHRIDMHPGKNLHYILRKITPTGMAEITPLMMKTAMPVSPSPPLPLWEREQTYRYANFMLIDASHDRALHAALSGCLSYASDPSR